MRANDGANKVSFEQAHIQRKTSNAAHLQASSVLGYILAQQAPQVRLPGVLSRNCGDHQVLRRPKRCPAIGERSCVRARQKECLVRSPVLAVLCPFCQRLNDTNLIRKKYVFQAVYLPGASTSGRACRPCHVDTRWNKQLIPGAYKFELFCVNENARAACFRGHFGSSRLDINTNVTAEPLAL